MSCVVTEPLLRLSYRIIISLLLSSSNIHKSQEMTWTLTSRGRLKCTTISNDRVCDVINCPQMREAALVPSLESLALT